jgi:hypothetical protein
MKVRHDGLWGRVYAGPVMRKQPSVGEPARAAASIQPLDPTMRQLAVLDGFAETGTYELTAAVTSMPPATVRNLLIEIQGHYGAATTIQAYRAALAAGDLSTPGGHCLTVRSCRSGPQTRGSRLSG